MKRPNNAQVDALIRRNNAALKELVQAIERLSNERPTTPETTARRDRIDAALCSKLLTLQKQNEILARYRAEKNPAKRKALWKAYTDSRAALAATPGFSKAKAGSPVAPCPEKQQVQDLAFDLSTARIAQLAAKPRASRTPAERAELCRLLGSAGHDRAFVAAAIANRARMKENLKKLVETDPLVQKAKASWHTLTGAEKKEFAKKILKAQRDAYRPKMGAPKVELFNEGWRTKPDRSKSLLHGSYSHGTNTMKLNTNPSADFGRSFASAVNVLCHEQAHKYQHALEDLLDAGKLKEGGPFTRQAKLWKANFKGYQSTSRGDIFACYEGQSVERSSRAAGTAAQGAVK